ncbi:leucyl aminopeptidase [Anaerococcus sp. Marseille-P9784]|uniref:leucyl aminopeptidase n=1 Tax=Anaerococcus sp. Marseille-P9784 TaxID=2614127 RepID=UPI00124A842A|nr:leucyl aminopeptidase [Anaerococcus sp. Marseille-P9784]
MKINFNDSKKNLVKFTFKDDFSNEFFDGSIGGVFPDLNSNLIYLGLGEKEHFDREIFKEAVYKLGRFFLNKEITEVSFDDNSLELDKEDYIYNIVNSLILAGYNFDYYKSEKAKYNIENINLPASFNSYEKNMEELVKVIDAQSFARDLVNLRSNDIYPETLANKAKEELSKYGVDVKIYEEDQIREMGLTAFLQVAKGSDNKPRFIVMEYLKANDDQKPLVFVGKGLTYDSGGYSIKSSDGMKEMNSDMGGSATVIGALKAIASNNLKVNVVGIVAACENSISGRAYKPGDVIKARNKMTIEVDNTDAEGRITLADAVNYGVTEYKPQMIIDLATLTGAVLVALGETYTGAITNNQQAMDEVLKAAKETDEKIWQLPNDNFLRKYNNSEVADIKNSGGRLAGSITAGQFVGAFIEDYPWVHLDIAGTAYLSKAQGPYQEGATGVQVKTLYQLAKNKAE